MAEHGRGDWRWPAIAMFTVGYGANQFVPLLAVYRRSLGLSDATATAIFGVYALGLIPGLLGGGWAADRLPRRRLMLGLMALSLLASVVLLAGRSAVAALYLGRFLAGLASGTVFTVGTAWVKELSNGPPGAGSHRAAFALTAGFGLGPLAAGGLAQVAPGPDVLPYVVHLALAGLGAALIPLARETQPPGWRGGAQPRSRLAPPTVTSRRFLWVVAPMAPWVFGSVTVVFTILPAHGAGHHPGFDLAMPGLLAAAALATGVVVQSVGRRLHESGHRALAPAAGLGAVAVGFGGAALATAAPGLVPVAVASLVLGAGYGICLVVGLREVEEIAAPEQIGSALAVFYCLAYSGLAVPYLIALLAPHLGYPMALLLGGATAGGTSLLLLVSTPPAGQVSAGR